MAATQLTLGRQTLVRSCTVLDTSFEQSVEKDFVLPDYCPDVFRILKCRVTPCVTSQAIRSGKLTVETEAKVRVIYLAENSGRLNLLEQKLSFSKTLDLPEGALSPAVRASAVTDYVNCRVVSRRRVDIRGAFTVRVAVEGEKRQQFISSAEGSGIQLKKIQAVFPSARLTASKKVTVFEELELGGAKPPVGAVIRTDCRVTEQEHKIIEGKLLTKGEARIEMVYIPADADDRPACETMRFAVPYSQIIDIEGLDESYTVKVELSPGGCEMIPKSDDPNSLECELILLVSCTALRFERCDAVTDAFSTRCACTVKHWEEPMPEQPRQISESFELTGSLDGGEARIVSVSAVRSLAGSISLREDSGKSVVSGSLTISALAVTEEDMPVYLETDIPFEYELEAGPATKASVEAAGCSYRLTDDSSVEVRTELAVSAEVSEGGGILLLEDIAAEDEPAAPERRYALKLCSVEAGEDLWELAKRCKTSVKAIIEENGLTSDKTEESGMLLIPLTD